MNQAPEPKVERLFTTKEVARLTASSRPTVMRWIIQGRLPAIKLGGGKTWRVRESDLAAFINGKPEEGPCS